MTVRAVSSLYDHRSGIYRFTHTSNKGTFREYIGSALDFHNRLAHHLSCLKHGVAKSRLMQHIYNKYGSDALIYEIIEVVDIPDGLSDQEVKSLLLAHEQVWLDKCQPVMNTLKIAGSTLGFKHSKESKELISQRLRERGPVSDETRAKLSAANTGTVLSEETKEKLRQANLGKQHTEESKAKMRGPRPHTRWSEERRQEYSNRLKGTTPVGLTRNKVGHEVTAKTREKLRQANLGKKRTSTKSEQLKSQEGD